MIDTFLSLSPSPSPSPSPSLSLSLGNTVSYILYSTLFKVLILSFSRFRYHSIISINGYMYIRPFDLKITSNELHVHTFMYLYDTKYANIAPIYIVVANQKGSNFERKKEFRILVHCSKISFYYDIE